jgi:hypothetical protein
VTALWAPGIVEWPLWLTPIALFIAALKFVHVGAQCASLRGWHVQRCPRTVSRPYFARRHDSSEHQRHRTGAVRPQSRLAAG